MTLIIAIGLPLALLALALFYQQIGVARDRKRYAPVGRVIETARGALYLLDRGSGTPAVVLEAGLAATSASWSYVQSRVAALTRVVSYDRAGLGESRECKERTLDDITADLKVLLESAGIPGPYILAGHSFGALIVRAFAHRYPADVAGLVFVDPVSLSAWGNCSLLDRRRIAHGVRLSRRGARLASFGIVRLALTAARLRTVRLTQSIARASAGKATPMLGRLAGEVQKLPPEILSTVQAHWSNPKSFRGMAAYLACLPNAAHEALAMPIPPHVPFVILSASTATAAELAERDEWIALSASGRHLRVPDTGHWLQLEKPQLIAEVLDGLIQTNRSKRRSSDDGPSTSD